MVNVPLLRKEIEFAKNHPEEHDQGVWINTCGTYGCLAGNTVLHAGFKPTALVGVSNMISFVEATPEQFNELNFAPHKFFLRTDKGDYVIPVEMVAAKLLGLNEDQASELFYPLNSVECMEELFEKHTGETL